MKTLFDMQRKFHENLYGDVSKLPLEDRERITQVLSLALHQEVASLAEAVHYKEHHKRATEPNLNNITYEAVDIIRYAISVLNTWDITPERFQAAYDEKNAYLELSQQMASREWNGQPVIIFDMDDVIVDFRVSFAQWLSDEHGIVVDVLSPEYYFIDALKESGYNPEGIFIEFLQGGGFQNLPPVNDILKVLHDLKDAGYWIHILTARPDENLRCKYDTYVWLKTYGAPIDRISFSAEKFRWCAHSAYYDSNAIICAIDDSPKHATEYANHGITTLVPSRSFNQKIRGHNNIIHYDDPKLILKIVNSLSNS